MVEKFKTQVVKALNRLRVKQFKLFSNPSRKNIVSLDSTYIPEEFLLALGKTPIHINEIQSHNLGQVELAIHSSGYVENSAIDYFSFKQPEEGSLDAYRGSIKSLVEFLEIRYKVSMTDAKLAQATRLMNETRYILSRFAEIRRLNNDFLDWETWEQLLHYSWILPREVFNKIAKKALRYLSYIPGKAAKSGSFILCSCGDEAHRLKKYLEEAGASISCNFESKDFQRFTKMIPGKNPALEAIVQSYFNQYPSILFAKDRTKNIESLVEKFQAQAVIYCIPSENKEYSKEIKQLEKQGLVILAIELDKIGEQFNDFVNLTFVKHPRLGS